VQGSLWTRGTRLLFDRGVLLTGALGRGGRLAAPLFLLAGCALAAIVNRWPRKRDGIRFRTWASSIALELTVKRAARPRSP
jgi:hypothetical protein